MTTADRDPHSLQDGSDPVTADRFVLEIDGLNIGWYLEVSGLELKNEVESYVEGGQNGFVHKFPGRMTWPSLVFKRGITKDDNLMEWVRRSSGEGFEKLGNKLERKTGAVSIVNHKGEPLRAWTLIDPFPVRWTGPRLSATDWSALSEEVEVAHHGFTTRSPGQW